MMFGAGMLLWPLLIVGLVWFLINQRDRPTQNPFESRSVSERPDARTLLDERYVRGEMEQDEYLMRRQDLD
ncbi:MAG TPA: SHOCT domain-containing protein [Thermoleophilia bacterium]|nr:SHOCT domain-containing protein [Thermoleophilia bacterium]